MLAKIFFTILYYSFYLLFPFIAVLIWQLYKNNKKRPIEIIVLLIISMFLIWARFIEPSFLLVKNYNFAVSDTPNSNLIFDNDSREEIKVVVFSDIHLGVFNNHLLIKKVVAKINKIKPDIVIIPGDFIYFADKQKLYNYFFELKNIDAVVVAVLGNHDYGKKEKDYSRDLTSVLESLGVLMVDNKVKKININNHLVELIGLADLWVGLPNYEILNKDGFEDEIDFTFLITHNPDSVYEIIAFTEQEENIDKNNFKNIDLMISGHTHAGQIRVPFLYKYIIPSKHNFNKGFYDIFGINLFITPGIGNVVLPMRLFNLPEISVINVLPK